MKKQTNHRILFILIGLIAVSSCQFSIHCPGYDLDDRRTISYRNNETIKYYSNNLSTIDSLELCVVDFYNQGEYEFTSEYPDAECCYNVYYQTNSIDGISIREQLSSFNTMTIQIGKDVYSFNLGYFTSDQIDSITSDYSIVYTSVMIDDVEHFCWILKDLSGKRRFDMFTKMDYKGITEFHDKQTDKKWSIKDNQPLL